MGMNIQSAAREMRTFLRAKLTDPLSSRASAFIYDNEMRVDLDKTPYPKILIKKTNESSLKEPLGIGNTSRINTDQIFIEIKAKKGEHYAVDETDYKAEEFVGYLAEQSENLIKSNHTYFVNAGFLSVLPVRDEMIKDKEGNPIYRLGIEMQYISDSN